jgi:hypothetical protein
LLGARIPRNGGWLEFQFRFRDEVAESNCLLEITAKDSKSIDRNAQNESK